MKLRELSPTELQLMTIAWEYTGDIALKELNWLSTQKFQTDHKQSTLGTYLTRLIDKGYISTYHIGRFGYVHVLITKEMYQSWKAEQMVSQLYDESLAAFVRSYLQRRPLSTSEINELIHLLETFKE